MRGPQADGEMFAARLHDAGIEECNLFSLPPVGFSLKYPVCTSQERLKLLMAFCKGKPNIHPLFWLNPLEDDSLSQVEMAVSAGVEGFKIICSDFYPSHERAMEAYRLIARHNKPILFHTGILWDGKVSSKYCHPIEYECLLEVPHLRFTLAHVSWPWFDTAIAVYGKFLNAQISGNATCEMFIDTTPGTPEIYRREVLTKLFTIGYDIEDNLLFGSDSDNASYNAPWTKEWIQRDIAILSDIGVTQEQIHKYLFTNARRFLAGGNRQKVIPQAGI